MKRMNRKIVLMGRLYGKIGRSGQVFRSLLWTAVLLLIILVSSCSSAPKRPVRIITVRNRSADLAASGNEALRQGRFEEAITFFRLSYETSRSIDFLEGAVDAENSRAKTLIITGRILEAEKFLQSAYTMAVLADYHRGIAINRISHAELLIIRDNPAEAIDVLLPLLEQSPPGAEETALIHHTLGSAYKKAGDYRKSMEHAELSLAINRKNRAHLFAASNHYLIASLYSLTGDYHAALAQAEKALEYDKLMENIPGIAADLYALGVISGKMQNREQAHFYFYRALKIYEYLKDEAEIERTIKAQKEVTNASQVQQ